jgi:hypothetical protein
MDLSEIMVSSGSRRLQQRPHIDQEDNAVFFKSIIDPNHPANPHASIKKSKRKKRGDGKTITLLIPQI